MWDMRRIKRIDLEITSFCNIKCSGCTRELASQKDYFNNREILSLELIKQKFRKEDWPEIKILNLCGSIDEPTSHPEFFDIIKFFKEWEIYISISTNGSIRSESWWTELGSILKDVKHHVIWGIDGIDETSEIYRQGSKFSKVQKNFRAFNKAGGRSTWQFIVMEHNKHQLDSLQEIAKQEGFDKVKIINSTRTEGNVVYVPVPTVESKEVECRYLTQGFAFINHLGEVVPCCYMNPDHLNASSPNFVHTNTHHNRYINTWKEFGGSMATNIKYNEIKDVIEGDFFDWVADSWNDKTNLLSRCEHFCKKKQQNKFQQVNL